MEAYLKVEPRYKTKISDKGGLSDIQDDVVENLELIYLLAEQVQKLDYAAYHFERKNEWNGVPYRLKMAKNMKISSEIYNSYANAINEIKLNFPTSIV